MRVASESLPGSGGLGRWFPAVHEMEQRKERMAPPHSRSRVSHDHSDTLAHLGFEAVNSAIDARGFVCAEGTAIDLLLRVVPERAALIA